MGSPDRDCPFSKQEEYTSRPPFEKGKYFFKGFSSFYGHSQTTKKGFSRDRSENDERMPAAALTVSGKKLQESAAYSQELLVKLRIFVYNILCIRDTIHIKKG